MQIFKKFLYSVKTAAATGTSDMHWAGSIAESTTWKLFTCFKTENLSLKDEQFERTGLRIYLLMRFHYKWLVI